MLTGQIKMLSIIPGYRQQVSIIIVSMVACLWHHLAPSNTVPNQPRTCLSLSRLNAEHRTCYFQNLCHATDMSFNLDLDAVTASKTVQAGRYLVLMEPCMLSDARLKKQDEIVISQASRRTSRRSM